MNIQIHCYCYHIKQQLPFKSVKKKKRNILFNLKKYIFFYTSYGRALLIRNLRKPLIIFLFWRILFWGFLFLSFPFQRLIDFTGISFCLHGFWWALALNCILIPLQVMFPTPPPSPLVWLPWRFELYLWFSEFNTLCLGYGFLVVLLGILWAS